MQPGRVGGGADVRAHLRFFKIRSHSSEADELGVALQLINILRDVQEDASRGRIYLPLDELKEFGITESNILEAVAPGGTRSWRCRSHARASCMRPVSASPSRSRKQPACACAPWQGSTWESSPDRAAPDLPLRGTCAALQRRRTRRIGALVAGGRYEHGKHVSPSSGPGWAGLSAGLALAKRGWHVRPLRAFACRRQGDFL